ncbi:MULTISPECIES: GNAT family N-acetyltransferase [Vibrio]|uniref:GNAT family N-acetyltransferase n=2 Tax=Vibrio TaxID=662 RepID=A0A7X4RWK8_9VIBR|nr:GNAT family N-acetyltransferase [Vibrio nitrifigilis]MBF9003495.1 GNAT family N-acetyltransferase [Vibrio nitrifigilis]MZI95452.1 GNAT family N-acetyltransferase [Vibrio eleionomae]
MNQRSMNIQVEKAQQGDLSALCLLNKQICQQHAQHAPNVFVIPSSEQITQYMQNILDHSDSEIWIAKLGNQAAGYVIARLTRNESVPFLTTHLVARIDTIVVDDEFQHCGIGQALFAACQQWCEQQGASEIRLEVMAFNQTAQRFYQQLGFSSQSHILSMSLSSN